MGRAEFFKKAFLEAFGSSPTPCQERFFSDAAAFLTSADHDIMVASGYAGTGKTSAMAAVVRALEPLGIRCVLLAPTGRSAKVFSQYAGKEAFTVHKHIYRQKSMGDNGFGEFSLSPNKSAHTLFIVDEVSLMGVSADSAGGSSAAFGSGDLLSDLVNFVRSGAECRLLMTGDPAQLPPVGLAVSPALDKDYMSSAFSGVCFSSFTTVVRQAAQSGILLNATSIRKMICGEGGSVLSLKTDGFDDIRTVMGDELPEVLSDAYSSYGEDETAVLTRSNRRAIRYNAQIRSRILFKEERLLRGDRLMVVKNCYQFLEGVKGMSYIANGDMAKLVRIGGYEDRYGLHFASATLSFPDYGDTEVRAKVILDTLDSESPSLTSAQSDMLYQGVSADYSFLPTKKKRYDAVREDPYFNAIQLKYSNAITCHKSQGGQWACVFIDNPFWQDGLSLEDLKWLYTAVTRARQQVYLVNFPSLDFKTI